MDFITMRSAVRGVATLGPDDRVGGALRPARKEE